MRTLTTPFLISLCMVQICFLCPSKGKDIAFKHFGAEEGLSQVSALALFQDSDGFLWVGTRNGLNRFDGYEFQTYFHSPWDTTSLINNEVSALAGGQSDEIWIGTFNGLCRFDRRSAKFKRYKSPVSNWRISTLVMDDHGDLWIISNTGVYRLENGATTVQKTEGLPNLNSIETAMLDHEGNVWFGGKKGLWVHHTMNKENTIQPLYTLVDGVDTLKHIKSIYQLSQKEFLFLSTKYLWEYNLENGGLRKTRNRYKQKDGSLDFQGRQIKPGFENQIWITSYEGIFVFDREKQSYVDRIFHDTKNDLSLTDHSIHSLLITSDGDRWIGSYSGGLNFYSGSQNIFELFRHSVTQPNGLSSNIINAFVEGPDHKLYVGTSRGGLNIYDPVTSTFSSYLNHTNIRHLLFDQYNTLWIGTLFDGLVRYDIETHEAHFYRYDSPDNSRFIDHHNTVHTSFLDHYGNLWVAAKHAIYLYDRVKDSFTKYPHQVPNSFVDHRINQVIQIRENLWVLTNSGIYIFNLLSREFIKKYEHKAGDKNSLPSNAVSSVTIDLNGTIWVATYGGLCQFNPKNDNFRIWTTEDGLPSNMLLCIKTDKKNRIWMSTSNGIAVMDKESGLFKIFDSSNNLQGNAFRDGACYSCRSGEFLFGGVNGYNKIDPDKMKIDSARLDVVITDILLFNQKISPGEVPWLEQEVSFQEEITIHYDQDVLTLKFQAADYSAPQKNRYAYHLEGFENSWNYVKNNKSATYTNLEPGEYIFHVKAANADGVYGEATSLKISITPPLWKTSWFKILAVLLIFVLMRVWHLHNIRSLTQKRIWLDREVAKRTKIINNQRKRLEEQNRNLINAEEEIRNTNNQLKMVNDNLEEMVSKRTKKLNHQNEKIREYAFLNSHKVRSPLVRILGLINLYDSSKLDLEAIDIINTEIRKSAEELDQITRNINYALDEKPISSTKKSSE